VTVHFISGGLSIRHSLNAGVLDKILRGLSQSIRIICYLRP
jgi:hypothetical protein